MWRDFRHGHIEKNPYYTLGVSCAKEFLDIPDNINLNGIRTIILEPRAN